VSTNTPAGSQEASASRTKYHRQIDEAFVEASRLAGSNLAPTEFYEQFLSRALAAIDAPAGVVWLRTPQGFLQIACQVNLDKIGLDDKRGGRQCHNEILRQVFQSNPPRPLIVEPQGRLTGVAAEPGAVPAANLTDHYALFAPIVQADKTLLGLLEVFHDAGLDARLYQTFLQYAVQMAGYASQYHSFSGSRQSSGIEKLFTQLDTFSKQVHGSLNPTEVAYHVANEGRRIIECDRLCVGVRHGRGATVEAVSGADVVEKASTHVRRMRILFDAVLKFGDKLVYRGTKDDGLPPDLSAALDHYLAESQPKLLVVAPVRDDREKDNGKPARSVMLMESFNPPEQSEALISRLDVVAKHAAPALYNAAELKRIPFRFVWSPISKLQEALGGKGKLYTALGIAAVIGLTVAMVMVPYQLKMPATGELLPKATVYVFAPAEGEVRELPVKPGDRVRPGAIVAVLRSDLFAKQAQQYDSEASSAEKQVSGLNDALVQQGQTPEALGQIRRELGKYQSDANKNRALLAHMRRLYSMQGPLGQFVVQAPRPEVGIPGDWQVLSDDKRPELLNRTVKGTDPLMRLGAVDGPWRVELKIPQRNIGHVARALADPKYHEVDAAGKKYLPVDILLGSKADSSFPGRLYEDDTAKEAVPNRDDHNEQEPIMLAYVRVNMDEFGPAGQIPADLRVAGVAARVRIRCGKHALGYSLFHGVWEWFYEKVIFAI